MLVMLLLLVSGAAGAVLSGVAGDPAAASGAPATSAPDLPEPDLLGLSGTMGTKERLELVKKLLKQEPLIDGHNDLPWNIRKFVHNRLSRLQLEDLRQGPGPWSRSKWSQTDLSRLRAGFVGGQFWAAYVPCEAQYLNAVQLTLEQVDVIKRVIAKYPAHLRAAASADGKCVVLRGAERRGAPRLGGSPF
ncbi:hypothetical protein ONE63_006206 [Megalurothrips usitatus]|uniref:Dipeptidase n=1 Tax=Megalurothrips usitatus TaxID=439358 RepID=A0AAV7XWN1_9NEOP|nr:hypothetical protein ONE63_006206 [Megalurothrips usitatus]